MKKTICILSFISVAIMTLSCVALFACIALREPLEQIIFNASDEITAEASALPIGQVVYAFGNLAVALVLLFNLDKRNAGFGTEVLCAVAVGAALPFLRTFLHEAQTIFTTQFQNELIALSYLNSLCNMALSFVGLAAPLMLVVCGMNIALKYTQRYAKGTLQ